MKKRYSFEDFSHSAWDHPNMVLLWEAVAASLPADASWQKFSLVPRDQGDAFGNALRLMHVAFFELRLTLVCILRILPMLPRGFGLGRDWRHHLTGWIAATLETSTPCASKRTIHVLRMRDK